MRARIRGAVRGRYRIGVLHIAESAVEDPRGRSINLVGKIRMELKRPNVSQWIDIAVNCIASTMTCRCISGS